MSAHWEWKYFDLRRVPEWIQTLLVYTKYKFLLGIKKWVHPLGPFCILRTHITSKFVNTSLFAFKVVFMSRGAHVYIYQPPTMLSEKSRASQPPIPAWATSAKSAQFLQSSCNESIPCSTTRWLTRRFFMSTRASRRSRKYNFRTPNYEDDPLEKCDRLTGLVCKFLLRQWKSRSRDNESMLSPLLRSSNASSHSATNFTNDDSSDPASAATSDPAATAEYESRIFCKFRSNCTTTPNEYF